MPGGRKRDGGGVNAEGGGTGRIVTAIVVETPAGRLNIPRGPADNQDMASGTREVNATTT